MLRTSRLDRKYRTLMPELQRLARTYPSEAWSCSSKTFIFSASGKVHSGNDWGFAKEAHPDKFNSVANKVLITSFNSLCELAFVGIQVCGTGHCIILPMGASRVIVFKFS
jgi:hypothetical protein